MREQWKAVRDYRGLYEVSNHGKVRNTKTGRCFSTETQTRPYKHVKLTAHDGIQRFHPIHRLVAEAFIKSPLQVNHKDGDKHNNNAENLEWMTGRQNMHHAYRLKLIKTVRGEDHSSSILTEDKVRDILRLIHEGAIPQYKIAAQFGVTPMVISNIKHGISWRHVTSEFRAV